jgi:hypothetical protein
MFVFSLGASSRYSTVPTVLAFHPCFSTRYSSHKWTLLSLSSAYATVRGTRLTLGGSCEGGALLLQKGADAVSDYPLSGHLLTGR